MPAGVEYREAEDGRREGFVAGDGLKQIDAARQFAVTRGEDDAYRGLAARAGESRGEGGAPERRQSATEQRFDLVELASAMRTPFRATVPSVPSRDREANGGASVLHLAFVVWP